MILQKQNSIENKRRLYLLHIPKTGGTSVAATVRHPLKKYGFNWHENSRPPHNYDFDDFIFIDAHLGYSDKLITPDTSIACLLRHPVDRAISNFLWIHDSVLSKKEEYSCLDRMEDRLRFYLFDDINYISHRNIQSQFICNPAKNEIFDKSFKFSYEDYSKSWFLEQGQFNIESVIKKIDSFEIVGITEHHDNFMTQIYSWFEQHYAIDINEFEKEYAIKSSISFRGLDYSTIKLVQSLSPSEYDKVIEINLVDYLAYVYASYKQSIIQ